MPTHIAGRPPVRVRVGGPELPKVLEGYVDTETGLLRYPLAMQHYGIYELWFNKSQWTYREAEVPREKVIPRLFDSRVSMRDDSHENPPPPPTKGEILQALPDLRAHTRMLEARTPLSDESYGE